MIERDKYKTETKKELEQLVSAYQNIRDECSLIFEDAVYNNYDGDESYQLIFKYYAVGIRMRIIYEFLVDGEPIGDDLIFEGDPYAHFTAYCYLIFSDFIKTLQEYRSDKEVIAKFIKYLQENKDGEYK